MKSPKTASIAILAFIVMGAALAGGPALLAHSKEGEANRRNMSARTLHTGMYAALEAQDYKRWRELTQGKKIQELITSEADFAKLIEAHQLMKDGKIEEAEAIFQELGIERPFMGAHHHPHGHGMRFVLDMSDEEFAKLDEARELFQVGDDAAAKSLLRELRESWQP